MKDKYNPPIAEILYLEKTDVLFTSGEFETKGDYDGEFSD